MHLLVHWLGSTLTNCVKFLALQALERAPTAVADTRPSPGSQSIPVTVDIDEPAAATTPSVPPSPSFTPFVDSKDWERDILGVARHASTAFVLSTKLQALLTMRLVQGL